jgi:predicted DNA binding CopG/RHH family protein
LKNTVKVLQDWKDLPEFEDEEEEANFWAGHMIEPRLMNASIHKPTVRESTTITLRFDPQMLSRIKRIARSRYLNYQSMMKQWLSERVEKELNNNNNNNQD